MKSNLHTILLTALLILFGQSLFAHDFEVNGIYYTYLSQADKTVSVSYQGSSYNEYSNEYTGNVVIPASVTYNGTTYSVTSIGNSAFYGCKRLTSIEIPSSVTSIGERAFYNCLGLTCIEIPSSVTSIGERAFQDCTGLTSIEIPSSVTSIGYGTFWGCSDLTSIRIPSSVTSIGSYAFRTCTGLTSIEIPSSVTSIGSNAFAGCTGLTSITIPNRVTSIGSDAFNGCTGLTSITIPNRVTSIGSDAFAGCTGLTKAEFSSIEHLFGIKFGSYFANPLYCAHNLYIGGEKITNLVVPSNVTDISYALSGCYLRALVIKSAVPPSIPTLSEKTFYHATLYVPVGTWETYAYDDAWYKFIIIREMATSESETSVEKAYTLMNAKTFDYAVYDPVNDCIGTKTSAGLDESNPNHCWQTMDISGKKYLYNIGAKKFAIASSNGLSLAKSVGSVEMTDGTNGIVLNGNEETQWALIGNEQMSIDLSAQESVLAIESVVRDDAASAQNCIDLQGRKVTKPQRGQLYLQDGKKAIVQ